MTQKQLKKIITMYKEGISLPICLASSIELNVKRNATSIEMAEDIIHIYRELFTITLKLP